MTAAPLTAALADFVADFGADDPPEPIAAHTLEVVQDGSACLRAAAGACWDGLALLAIKPYPCVSFLHPALDALFRLGEEHGLRAEEVESIVLRFSRAGGHCIDANPLKSHCAQYVLPVALDVERYAPALEAPLAGEQR